MKSVTDLLHRTPWWALAFGGLATFVALAVFVTPYHILQYQDDGRTAEESRAIKREIDNTFAENAINVGRGVVRGMLARTTDPERRAELEEALAGLEEARQELREAGTEVLRAKREALQSMKEASRATLEAVRKARRETELALKNIDPEDAALRKQLEESLKAAENAEREAEQALAEQRTRRIVIGPRGGKPSVDIQIDALPRPPAPPAAPATPGAPGALEAPPPPPEVAAPQLPPEVATRIRRDVTGDMYRIGIGAGVILILLPLFVIAVVTKFFADRSRASQRVAEAKRKEADYARMAQQVTEAKLSALQAQVEPHFLYNTLASVQALTEVDPAKASEMTGHLIQYLRNALPKMRESVSTVGQEVELVRAYLSILQMRMGSRLAFDIEVPEALMALPFPPLMLPSLVENAIKHGLEPQREGGAVRIGAALEGDRLRVVVADTGRGFADTVGAGVGLANIRERLAALYSGAARLTLEGNAPHGVVATIEVPADGTGSGAAASMAASESQAATREAPRAAPGAPAAADAPAVARKAGFWPRTWEALVLMERIWRKALYYLYLGLLVLAAVAAVGAVVGIGIGAIPVVMDNDVVSGPLGVVIGLAGAVIGFFAVAAALALVMLVFYGLGFFMLGLALFVVLVALLAISPLVAPFLLLALAIWWIARKRSEPPAPRVEPVLQTPPSAPPAPSAEPGR
jgi:Histidine kinase